MTLDMNAMIEINKLGLSGLENVDEFITLANEAERFLKSQKWCKNILRGMFDRGWCHIIGVFYFSIEPTDKHIPNAIWVIVGDLPSAYIDVEDNPNGACAIDAYVMEIQKWIDYVIEGKPVEDLIPIRAPKTKEYAKILQSRIDVVKNEILANLNNEIKSGLTRIGIPYYEQYCIKPVRETSEIISAQQSTSMEPLSMVSTVGSLETACKMFQWLSKEIEDIHTKKFHSLEKIDSNVIEGMYAKFGGLPKSYHVFLSIFGKATLYREFDGYLVGVYPLFEEAKSKEKGSLYCFGHFAGGSACFWGADIRGQDEAPVFELSSGTPKQVSPDFATWLFDRCQLAKKRYSKKEWEKILRGPRPFDKREVAIIEARKLFEWELLERTAHGMFRIRIKNNSDMVLPFLTIGIRHCANKFEGGMWLPVSNIGPGQTGEVEMEPYLSLAPAEEQEVFPRMDPEPEDRELFWEFRKPVKE